MLLAWLPVLATLSSRSRDAEGTDVSGTGTGAGSGGWPSDVALATLPRGDARIVGRGATVAGGWLLRLVGPACRGGSAE